MALTLYVHTSFETGERYTVFCNEHGDRWYYDPILGTKLVLPYFPNSAHGRYYFDQIKNGMTRREYRRYHDDYMLPTPTVNRRSVSPDESQPKLRSNFRNKIGEVL